MNVTGKVMMELPEEIMMEIEYWAKEGKIEKSTMITKILKEGLSAWKMNKALEMYRLQKVTLWKAAEIAGVSLGEILAELPKKKIIFQYDLDELREDFEYVRGK
jgi:predicted HTH domain antitoxin